MAEITLEAAQQLADKCARIAPLLRGPESKWFADHLRHVVLPLLENASAVERWNALADRAEALANEKPA